MNKTLCEIERCLIGNPHDDYVSVSFITLRSQFSAMPGFHNLKVITPGYAYMDKFFFKLAPKGSKPKISMMSES